MCLAQTKLKHLPKQKPWLETSLLKELVRGYLYSNKIVYIFIQTRLFVPLYSVCFLIHHLEWFNAILYSFTHAKLLDVVKGVEEIIKIHG